MSKTIKCQGCGAILQTEDQNQPGYVLDVSHDYCQACFKLLHYGDAQTHFHPKDLPSLPDDALIFMVSSVLHLDLLFSHPVYRYQPTAHFVYIINQIDLLPTSTNLDLLVENITKKAVALNVPYVDIILMSSKNPYDIDQLKAYIETFKSTHIYLLGVQNAGKTTIFKALTQHEKALAFKKAGLTQEALSAPYKDKIIYDMPGLYQQGYLHQMLPYTTYKKLIPDQRIKPRIYQMKKNQSIILEGLLSVSFQGDALILVIYVSQDVKIHKTNQEKVKNLFENKAEHFEIYVPSYEDKHFKVPQGKYQLTLADMGFIHVQGPVTLKLTQPKGLHVTLTEALFQ